MHTYRKHSDGYEVGYYGPSRFFSVLKKFKDEELAARYTSFLNGGNYCIFDRKTSLNEHPHAV